jgi:hypothetical protein
VVGEALSIFLEGPNEPVDKAHAGAGEASYGCGGFAPSASPDCLAQSATDLGEGESSR